MKPATLILLLAFLAAGCATTKVSYMFMKPEAWREELARRGVDARSVPDPLLVSEQIGQVAVRLAGAGTPPERLQRLQQGLF
ncbi:MAG: hypothetical protein B7Z61_13515, partial [Acidobacteria bacterium 37-71-11]